MFQWRSSVNLHNWNTLDDHWSHKYTGMPLAPHWLMLAPSGVPVAVEVRNCNQPGNTTYPSGLFTVSGVYLAPQSICLMSRKPITKCRSPNPICTLNYVSPGFLSFCRECTLSPRNNVIMLLQDGNRLTEGPSAWLNNPQGCLNRIARSLAYICDSYDIRI